MECNKDEATRAKSIAESKLEQKDFVGAKKLALKAQTLYPGLYGISHMLTSLDVHLAAENKIYGEVDWYRVLGANPSDDDDTIKRQYKKLALLLHPDKNNSVGADGAFKLISEAWRLLGDKEKRMAYNQRRGRGFQHKVQTHPSGTSAPCRPHQHNAPAYTGGQSVPPRPSQKKVPSAAPRRSQKKVTPNPAPPHYRPDTFCTVCRGCNIYFEYLKIYCDCLLLCRICQKPFKALETAPPVNFSKFKPVPLVGQVRSLKKLASQNGYDPKRNVAAAQKAGDSPNCFTYPVPGTGNSDIRYPSFAA